MVSSEKYELHATTIVGTSISLLFSLTSLVAFVWFRPKTELFLIKKHFSIAISLAQFLLLINIVTYKSTLGCKVFSVLLHMAASSCFCWSMVDALYIYFLQLNSVTHRKLKYYVLGWGVSLIVMCLTLGLAHAEQDGGRPVIPLYSCWGSDVTLWGLFAPVLIVISLHCGLLMANVNHLKQPSYDVSEKSVVEKEGIRYGLKTNALILLVLALSWVFAVLAFRTPQNTKYQLVFGLFNGMQGLFVFFFHCVLNVESRADFMERSKNDLEDSFMDIRNKKGSTAAIHEFQTEPQKHAAKTPTAEATKTTEEKEDTQDHIPLISVEKPKPFPRRLESIVKSSPTISSKVAAEDPGIQAPVDMKPRLSIPGTTDLPDDDVKQSFFPDPRIVPIEQNNNAQRADEREKQAKRLKASSESALFTPVKKVGDTDLNPEKKRPLRDSSQSNSSLNLNEKQRPHKKKYTSSLNELELLFSNPDAIMKPRSAGSRSPQRRHHQGRPRAKTSDSALYPPPVEAKDLSNSSQRQSRTSSDTEITQPESSSEKDTIKENTTNS